MIPKYTAKCRFDKESLMEIRKHLTSPIESLICHIIVFFLLFSAFIYLSLKNYKNAGVLCMVAIAILSLMRLASHALVLRLSKYFTELTGNIDLNLLFYDNFFVIAYKNELFLKIYYMHIKKIVPTKNFYTLFAKENVFFPITIDSLENEEEFLFFFSTQNNKTKIKKSRKYGGKVRTL